MIRRCATLLMLLGLLAVLPSTAHAATCKVPAYPTAKGEYTSLKVTKTTCAEGLKVAKAFYTCRTKTGPLGRCVSKVRGYACQEQRSMTTPGEFTAKATCSKGKRKLTIGYRQTT